ncbi:calcium-binding protein [Neotabrizicola shimadae]|uniref:Calcium-binding protein n=1 Tax=Neotabrizicola shimadae TaxID=2807096 RepID=A0A8G1EEI7_9RHOB|nr:calcium-binding protein [Neotabrizicola shimadae]QYZ71353.1 hypothetical protein JO391_07575 [Neotabrizicola shimadae]
MSTVLYTYGEFVVLTPGEFLAYTQIQYAPGDTTTTVQLGLSIAGTIDFSSRLGMVPVELVGSTGSDNVTLGGGDDSVWADAGDDTVYGGDGNDSFMGDWFQDPVVGNDVLYGGAGDDEFAGGFGNDWLFGGDGNDIFNVVEVSGGNDTVLGGEGSDTVWLWDGFDNGIRRFEFNYLMLDATSSVEYFYVDSYTYDVGGTDRADTINLSNALAYTWDGYDFSVGLKFDLRLGADTYVGGAGKETVIGRDGGDLIALGAGDDRLEIFDGNLVGDTLIGGDGNDTLVIGQYSNAFSDYFGGISGLGLSDSGSFETVIIYARGLVGTNESNVFDLGGVYSLNVIGPFQFDLAGSNDTFRGSAAWDTVFGGSGNDRLEGRSGGDALIGAQGDDLLYGGGDADSLNGGTGRDTLYGEAGNDLLVISGRPMDADVLFGGVGVDTLQFEDGVSLESIAFGAAVGIEFVRGSAGITAVNGTELANVFDFRGVSSQPEAPLLRFNMGGGNDIVNAGALSQLDVNGGDGNDTLTGTLGNDSFVGGAGNDVMTGGAGNDTYRVDSAGDVLIEAPIGSSIDTIETFMAEWTLANYFENLTHFGSLTFLGTGNSLGNRLVGALASDTLFGLGGADSLFGGAGNDLLEGGDGDDLLQGDSSADTLIGGLGNDTYVVHDGLDVIIESANGGVDTALVHVSLYTLTDNFENGTIALLTGGKLTGNASANVLLGAAGRDTLIGGLGNDTLNGLEGLNSLMGGSGNDTYIFSAGTIIVEAAGEGIDTVLVNDVSFSLVANVENLEARVTKGTATQFGNELDNAITLTYSALNRSVGSAIYGMDGNDTLSIISEAPGGFYYSVDDSLYGGSGDDTYILTAPTSPGLFVEMANQGRDTVLSESNAVLDANIEVLRLTGTDDVDGFGNAMSNVLVGNSGANSLYASNGKGTNSGRDTLTGGEGADNFVFGDLQSQDRVTDMQAGVDRISLSSLTFQGLSRGELSADAFKVLGTEPLDASDRILYRAGTGQLLWDPDGSGAAAATVFLVLENRAAVTAADFFIV